MPEHNLNPDALHAAWESNNGYTEGIRMGDVERMVTAYLSALPAQPDTVSSVEELVMTRAGLALANTAFGEGLSAGIQSCNAAEGDVPFKKPVSPYSAPLLAMIKADRPEVKP